MWSWVGLSRVGLSRDTAESRSAPRVAAVTSSSIRDGVRCVLNLSLCVRPILWLNGGCEVAGVGFDARAIAYRGRGRGVSVEYVLLWVFLLLVIGAVFWLPATIPLIQAML
jgi:hypothetical protein